MPSPPRDHIEEPEVLLRDDGSSVYTVAGADLYTSQRILDAEQRLLTASGRLDGASAEQTAVELALLEIAANGTALDGGQASLVRQMCTSAARLQLAIARTKTEARNKLRALLRDHDDGLPTQRAYTVGEAVEAWLVHGLVGRDPNTVANRTILARTHVIPGLGKRRLTELTAEEVDRWLADKASTLSTDTLRRLLSILRQSIRRAQARDLVKRNVALLCDLPKGQPGRPSKSLTREQAERAAGENPTMMPMWLFPCSLVPEPRNCGR